MKKLINRFTEFSIEWADEWDRGPGAMIVVYIIAFIGIVGPIALLIWIALKSLVAFFVIVVGLIVFLAPLFLLLHVGRKAR